MIRQIGILFLKLLNLFLVRKNMQTDQDIYLHKQIEVVNNLIKKLECKDIKPDSSYYRAFFLIQSNVEKDLSNLGLIISEKSSQEDEFWSEGAEIVYSTYSRNEKYIKKYLVKKKNGTHPDDNQEMLILEYQVILLKILLSLDKEADHVIDLISTSLIDHAIARFSMHNTLCCSWKDDNFWNGYILPSTIFNQKLLSALKQLLVRNYEGSRATASIYLIDKDFARKLRWTPYLQQGLEIFTEYKFGRKLSGGKNISFFFSGDGEFFGIFDKSDALSQLKVVDEKKTPMGICEWRVESNGSIQFFTKGKIVLEYHDGLWRYVNLERSYDELLEDFPIFSKVGKKVWDVVCQISALRRSAIFLIVDDVNKLIEDKACSKNEINIPSNKRFAEEKIKKECPSIDFSNISLDNPIGGCIQLEPKDLILEQLRDEKIDSISENLLIQLASIDGALLIGCEDRTIHGFGIILELQGDKKYNTEGAGARTLRLASKYGIAIKVSEDGPISVFYEEKCLLGK